MTIFACHGQIIDKHPKKILQILWTKDNRHIWYRNCHRKDGTRVFDRMHLAFASLPNISGTVNDNRIVSIETGAGSEKEIA